MNFNFLKTTNNTNECQLMILNELRKIIPFEASCFTMVDPETFLSTGAVTDKQIEDIHSRLFENEYLTKDYNAFTTLAKSPNPIVALSQTTNGNLTISPRYRDILLPAGFGDELRVAFIHQGKCWGFLTLLRYSNQPHFCRNELKQLTPLLPQIAQSLQEMALNSPLLTQKHKLESAIIIVNEQFDILTVNTAAEKLLEWLREKEKIERDILPRPIRALCIQAKANDMNLQKKNGEAKVCMRTSHGEFITIQASKLNSPTMQFAVITERAKPIDILALLLDSYGLTSREKQLVEQLLHGDSTKQLAEALSISVHTVQDHLKSIFVKTGASSRRELIWLLLTRFSFPESY